MSHDDEQDTFRYTVVVNHEEQYALWLADNPLPAGWSEAGKSGTRAECLAFVEEVWTDMRPKSLRAECGEARC